MTTATLRLYEKRFLKAEYKGTRERTDNCGNCQHGTPYMHSRAGKIKCPKVGWYVQTGGICKHHTPPVVEVPAPE